MDFEDEAFADVLLNLPAVRTLADVDTLPADALGVRVFVLTDEMLQRLAERVPDIRYIAGDGHCRVTDDGASVLSRFTHLEWLDLEWSNITDAGLESIAKTCALRRLDLCGSAVTPVSVSRLRRLCPHLVVEVLEP